MKHTLHSLFLALATLFPLVVSAASGIEIRKTNGEIYQLANSDIQSLTFSGANALLTSASGTSVTIGRSEIREIVPIDNVAEAYTVTYDGTSATVVNPYLLRGVTTSIQGGYVTTTNTNTSDELTFTLTGTTTDGGYEYNGSYKCTLQFDNANITSQQGAAVNILCGKRIAVVVNGSNTLKDYASGSQKAALYFKGHPEFEGSGLLTITGTAKHALSTNEYLQLKKSFGTLSILGAANDGIHAGQYFKMNGGTVNVRNVKGDGIQAEATDNADDELNGQMIINGGYIDVLCDANGTYTLSGTTVETSSVACLKSDALMTLAGGNITLKTTGKGGKGISTDGALVIGATDTEGPTIVATTTGAAVYSTGRDVSGGAKAIKADGDITIHSGTITATTSQNGGEGIESKANFVINGGTIVCNTYDDGLNATGGFTFNGGLVWSRSSNNDGIDANGTSGFTFNGGIVLSSGASAPEEGFDCDNNSFVINGGTLIGTGGATSNPTRATQPYSVQSRLSLTSNTYVSLVKADGTVICSYRVPNTLSSATVLVSSPEFQSGTSHRLVRNVTSVSNPTASYLDGAFVVGGTISGGTSTSFTPTTR